MRAPVRICADLTLVKPGASLREKTGVGAVLPAESGTFKEYI
jgi:hypothetical protein